MPSDRSNPTNFRRCPHRITWVAILISALLVTGAVIVGERAYTRAAPGEAAALGAVATLSTDWLDAARSRAIPAKIYYPRDAGTSPSPVVIFSHGLGGTRNGYAYLGQHWASRGYVSVHLQHAGSDDSVWKNAEQTRRLNTLQKASLFLTSALDRPKDVSYAIDALTRLNDDAASPLHGRLDLTRVGVAGHSFGGFTAMAIAGQDFGSLASGVRLRDPRVKAVIEMSAPAPFVRTTEGLDAAIGAIRVPVFHLTGTLDDSPVGETKARDRRLSFDHAAGDVPAYLLTLTGGDHFVFSGRRRKGDQPTDARFRDIIQAGTTAYWDAYLRDDDHAKTWFQREFAKTLANDGVFETNGGEISAPARGK